MAKREAKPYFKKSHGCWYVNLDGKQTRLDPDEKEANKIWKSRLDSRVRDKAICSNPSTLAVEIIDEFLGWAVKTDCNGKLVNLAPSTLDGYREALESFAKHPLVRKLRMAELKPLHVTKWLDASHANSGPTTRHNAIAVIKRAFNWAMKEGYIEKNPIAHYAKPTPSSRGEDAYITPEQWPIIFDAIKNVHRKAEAMPFLDYTTVLKETGCRPQEIKIVESKHFDRQDRCWVFPKEESKGRKHKRVVHLSDAAFAICERLALKYPDGPMFRNYSGQPWTPFSVSCRFKRIEAKTGIKLFAYAFRHTFATDAILRGVDLMILKELMGHRDLTMLSKIYQHVNKNRDCMKAGLRRAIGQDSATKPKRNRRTTKPEDGAAA